MRNYIKIPLCLITGFIILLAIPIVATIITLLVAPLLTGNLEISLFIFIGASMAFMGLCFGIGRRLPLIQKCFPRNRGLIVVTVVIISPGCAFAGVLIWHTYTTIPFSSPAPFPSATVEEVWKDVGHGHYGTVAFEYVVEIPLDEMEQYYDSEMAQYCTNKWHFTETEIACQGYTTCRIAECEIPRPFVKDAQFFSVYLRSISEVQTNVLYIEKTINP